MLARLYAAYSGYITGGLALAFLVASLGWYVTDAKLDACQANRKADTAAYEKAQADATVLHLEALRKKEKEYADKAKKADEAYGALASKYRDAVRVYVTGAQSKARRTSPASEGGSAASDYRPGENPQLPEGAIQPELDITEVTVVPVSDLMICAENTARLVIARDWALGLNDDASEKGKE